MSASPADPSGLPAAEWDDITARMKERGRTVKRAVVVRDVAKGEPHNYLHRDVAAGEVLYDFVWNTWGCVDDCGGVALSERPGERPFFEFPANAVRFEAALSSDEKVRSAGG